MRQAPRRPAQGQDDLDRGAISVRKLVEMASLELRVRSGETGLDRPVSWAHAVEIEHPWEWLDAGDLLMTVGIGLPSDAAGQVEYLANLADAGVSGIGIGDGFPVPRSRHRCVLLPTSWEYLSSRLATAYRSVRSVGP